MGVGDRFVRRRAEEGFHHPAPSPGTHHQHRSSHFAGVLDEGGAGITIALHADQLSLEPIEMRVHPLPDLTPVALGQLPGADRLPVGEVEHCRGHVEGMEDVERHPTPPGFEDGVVEGEETRLRPVDADHDGTDSI